MDLQSVFFSLISKNEGLLVSPVFSFSGGGCGPVSIKGLSVSSAGSHALRYRTGSLLGDSNR